MEKIQENRCKQACSYVFVQENYINARLLVFSPFSAHFYPPLHHNGKKGLLEQMHSHSVNCNGLPIDDEVVVLCLTLPLELSVGGVILEEVGLERRREEEEKGERGEGGEGEGGGRRKEDVATETLKLIRNKYS